MRFASKLATLLLPLLCGCTHVSTLPVLERTDPTEARRGMHYSLPMLQYQIATTYHLASCGTAQDEHLGAPTFKIEATAAAQYVPGEEYEIDNRALSGPLKTTDFTILNYPNGNLQSINVSVVSHEADLIHSAVELGTKVAALTNPVTAPLAIAAGSIDPASDRGRALAFLAAHPAETVMVPVCTQKAVDFLALAATQKALVESLTHDVNADTPLVEAIARRATLKLTDTADRRRMADVQTRLIGNSQRLEAAIAALAETQQKLRFVDSRDWPTDPFLPSERLPINARMVAWLNNLVAQVPIRIRDVDALEAATAAASRDGTLSPGAQRLVVAEIARLRTEQQTAAAALAAEHGESIRCQQGQSSFDCLQTRLTIHATLQSYGPRAAAPCAHVTNGICADDRQIVLARDHISDPGIFIRPPGRARLILCDRGMPCAGTEREPILETAMVSAPQAGQLRFIELTSRPFESNTLSIALREDGSVERQQYAEHSAVAAEMVASAAAATGAVDTYLDSRHTQQRTLATQAREDRAATRTETAAIRAEAAAALAAPRTEAAAARADAAGARAEEIAQLRDQIAVLQAQKQLLDAQADRQVVPQDLLDEKMRIDAQVALLTARVAQRQAEQALAAAGP